MTSRTRLRRVSQADHDPALYGSSFADVYDNWYPPGDTGALLECIAAFTPPGGRVLELGVGTGRLALPLADAGYRVVGMDSSVEMLDVLRAKDPESSVEVVLADAGDPATWPAELLRGDHDCILAACNLMLNLSSHDQQRSCVEACAGALRRGGVLVVELDDLEPPAERGEGFALSTALGSDPVVVSTEYDPESGSVLGHHIELHPDGGSRVRPWRVHPVGTDEVTRWCEDGGLAHVATLPGFPDPGAAPGTPRTVTVHRRPTGT